MDYWAGVICGCCFGAILMLVMKVFEKEVEREKARVLRNLEMRLWR